VYVCVCVRGVFGYAHVPDPDWRLPLLVNLCVVCACVCVYVCVCVRVVFGYAHVPDPDWGLPLLVNLCVVCACVCVRACSVCVCSRARS